MGNRILKESICTSDQINSLPWMAEATFYRLIVNCDDFGRMDGRPAILKGRLFPLKDNLTIRQISDAIKQLASAGLIVPYQVDGRPYLYLPSWERHQTIRAKKSKFPPPEAGNEENASAVICNHLQADESNCLQMFTESNPNPNPNPKGKGNAHPPAKEKQAHGEYANVLLTEAELEALKAEFPAHWQALIDKLSGYMQQHGKTYKDHLATMRNWGRKDGLSAKNQPAAPKMGTLEQEAIRRMMGGGDNG